MRALAVLAVLSMPAVLAAGCTSEGFGRRPSWDPDAPVVPALEPAVAQAETAPTTVAAVAKAPPPPSHLHRYVVLLAEADGKVGALDVATPGGDQTLTRAGQAVDFDDPSRPVELSADEIAAGAGSAFDAEPAPPQRFVVYCEIGRTEMTAESRAGWGAVVTAVTGRPVPEVTVTGYADRAGEAASNLELSRRRAEVVRDRLVAAGVDPAWIEVAWFGEDRPAVTTPDGAAEPRNRRVELRVR
jgi:outer membrane protein OmpA-like peptidoglycan-associated protein